MRRLLFVPLLPFVLTLTGCGSLTRPEVPQELAAALAGWKRQRIQNPALSDWNQCAARDRALRAYLSRTRPKWPARWAWITDRNRPVSHIVTDVFYPGTRTWYRVDPENIWTAEPRAAARKRLRPSQIEEIHPADFPPGPPVGRLRLKRSKPLSVTFSPGPIPEWVREALKGSKRSA